MGTLSDALRNLEDFILDGALKILIRKNGNDTYIGGRESAENVEGFKQEAADKAIQQAKSALQEGAKELSVIRNDDGDYIITAS